MEKKESQSLINAIFSIILFIIVFLTITFLGEFTSRISQDPTYVSIILFNLLGVLLNLVSLFKRHPIFIFSGRVVNMINFTMIVIFWGGLLSFAASFSSGGYNNLIILIVTMIIYFIGCNIIWNKTLESKILSFVNSTKRSLK